MKPNSYRIENGCHNCKYSIRDFTYYACNYLCAFRSELPKDPTKGIDYLTDHDVESFTRYNQKKASMCVESFGKCDEWEMREEEYERRKKIN